MGKGGSRGVKSSSTPGPTSRSFRPSTVWREEVRTEGRNSAGGGRGCRSLSAQDLQAPREMPRTGNGVSVPPPHTRKRSLKCPGLCRMRGGKQQQGPSSPAIPGIRHPTGTRRSSGLWDGHSLAMCPLLCDGEEVSPGSSPEAPSPSRMASCSSRSPRGDSRDSERKRPLGRVGRGTPLPPSSSTWKWVISANSPTFSCSSSTSARSFCCSSTVDEKQVSTRKSH